MRSAGLASSSEEQSPHLSVVATARNDDHGGNLLGRMQVFVDAWINQCKKHNLASELILVEWNPPPDRPKLAKALRWPSDTGPCHVRIIEVPPELHQRYRHAAALPLYQMIAKNVGIRRARGEFIVATNIDVVFSDELVEFLAQRKLRTGHIYRIDRTDVTRDVPVDGTLEEQLAYCASHVIRLCARDGIFALTPAGMRCLEPKDIIRPDSGIWYGSGWSAVELYTDKHFRWIRDEAEVFVQAPAGGCMLQLEVEPGPGIGTLPGRLQVLDQNGSQVAEWSLFCHTTIRLHVPPSEGKGLQLLRFQSPDGGRPVPHDPRIMNFRFFSIDWAAQNATEIHSLQETLRASRRTLASLVLSVLRAGSSSALALPKTIRRTVHLFRSRGVDIFDARSEFRIGQGWHGLEHLPGGERFRHARSGAELSFRFGDGSKSLAMVVKPGPTIGYRPFDLVVRTKSGEPIGSARVSGLTYVEFPVAADPGEITAVVLNIENAEAGSPVSIPGDDRQIGFSVHACGRGGRRVGSPTRCSSNSNPGAWHAYTVGARPAGVDWQEELKDYEKEIAAMGLPQFLHLSACGDFQLMSRENWADVRGYAELDHFSMHLDSLLSYTANHMGIREECLPAPMRIYHLEHDVGTGWTPEGYKELSARIAKKGIQMITFEDLTAMVAQMRRLHASFVFNLDTWGMADCDLRETFPVPATTPTL
jgi:hypothetical protein